MIIASNVYTVSSENRDTAIKAMRKVSQASLKIEGITNHGFYEDLREPNTIRFYGEFASPEAVKSQHESQHAKEFWELMKELGVTTSGGMISTYTPLPEDS